MNGLKKIMNERMISQTRLARDAGVSQPLINAYITNKSAPSVENLCKIADYLHVTTDELLGRDTRLINTACLDNKTQEVIKQVMNLSSNQLDLALQFLNALNNNN